MSHNNRTFGSQKMFMDVLLKHINARHYVKEFDLESFVNRKDDENLKGILIMQMAVAEFKFDIEYVTSDQIIHIHFMVAPKRANIWVKILAKAFKLEVVFLHTSIYFSFTVAYMVVFKRRPHEWLRSMPLLFAISLLQPYPHPLSSRSRRLVFMTIATFAFFTTTALLCTMTSEMVSYAPDPTVKTRSQILDDTTPIYSNRPIGQLLQRLPFQEKEAINKRLVEQKHHPWLDHNSEHETYVTTSDLYGIFSKTALNLNDYGQTRFYLVSPEIMSVNMFYLFDRKSPYTRMFRKFHGRVNEAGLYQYWMTLSMTSDKYPHFSYFRVQPFLPTAIPLTRTELRLVIRILLVGLVLCGIVFLVEVVFYHGPIIKRKLFAKRSKTNRRFNNSKKY